MEIISLQTLKMACFSSSSTDFRAVNVIYYSAAVLHLSIYTVQLQVLIQYTLVNFEIHFNITLPYLSTFNASLIENKKFSRETSASIFLCPNPKKCFCQTKPDVLPHYTASQAETHCFHTPNRIMINMIFYTRLNFLTHAILLTYPNSHLFNRFSHTLHLETLQLPPCCSTGF
jgi:hypothetical protein